MIPKFKKGDSVKIVKYGHLVYNPQNCTTCGNNGSDEPKDHQPEIIGRIGIVERVIESVMPIYSLSGIPEKSAWFNEEQLVEA